MQSDYKLSGLTVKMAIELVIEAENKLIWDTVESACKERKRFCEIIELSEESEATLKDNGFKVSREERLGGEVIIIKWG